jgi:endonuclease III
MKKSLQKEEERKKRLEKILKELKKLFPKVSSALSYKKEYEFLFAVILSAQCTDKRVNEVTKKAFRQYQTLSSFVTAPREELEKVFFSTGFYVQKAKYIQESAEKINTFYRGKVPCTMKELCSLSGVGRKTAHVVLGELYNRAEGIAIDTHVMRFVYRFDLTESTTPLGIEKELMRLLPKKEWSSFTHRVIEYGRKIAPARKYDIEKDPLIILYPPAGKVFKRKK